MNTQVPTSTNGAIKTLQILNILGFLLMVLFNFLANWLPLNGKTTGELSDNYPNLFVPSGPTFSIWGVIYLFLLIFTIYQARTLFTSQSSVVNAVVHHLGIWYLASSILNTLWIIAWHYELLPVSVAIMWLLLLSLILANFGVSNSESYLSAGQKFLTKATFGIYLGWISVATIANMTAWLTAIQWSSGLEEDTWAVIMILIGTMLTLYGASRLSNGYLTLAVVWAFVGIIFKRTAENPMYFSITYVAGGCALLLFIYSLVLIRKDMKLTRSQPIQPSRLYE